VTRRADDIGAGLLPARPARAIMAGERIHVIGAAGAGASAAALLAQHAGASVSGCDPGGSSPYTAALEAAGLPMAWQHDPGHVAARGLPLVERAAVTKALTSIAPDHPELSAARSAGIPLEPWQQLVADAAATRDARLIAVAGTHGKSTTSGWLVDVLVRADRDPSAFVGALLPAAVTGGLAATARWGNGAEFVVEADEYAGNFDAYQPDVVLLLNAEWDHPDVFADRSAVLDAFAGWLFAAADRRPTLVANVGDAGVADLVRHRLAGWPGKVLTVALDGQVDGGADLAARLEAGAGRSRLHLADAVGGMHTLELGLPGRHNAENAVVVLGAARVLDVDERPLRESLAGYSGVGRRLELKGDVGGVVVLDDYGHHPTAIARTIEAVRQRYPGRRLWGVYEPLTYHRTAEMLDHFADVLARGADRVAIADIWAGRDRDTSVTSARALAEAVARRGLASAVAPGSVEATADYLAGEVERGDVVLVMGGGRSYVIAERLVGLLAGGSR
jgi:UDP-N-acetylmuramate--alanine ligase